MKGGHPKWTKVWPSITESRGGVTAILAESTYFLDTWVLKPRLAHGGDRKWGKIGPGGEAGKTYHGCRESVRCVTNVEDRCRECGTLFLSVEAEDEWFGLAHVAKKMEGKVTDPTWKYNGVFARIWTAPFFVRVEAVCREQKNTCKGCRPSMATGPERCHFARRGSSHRMFARRELGFV